MQRNQIISYIRTAGLTIGVLLFVFLSYRSGQSATSKVAVEGKRSLWFSGQVFGQSATYNGNLSVSENTLATAGKPPAAKAQIVSENIRANSSDKPKTHDGQTSQQTDTSQPAPKPSNVGQDHTVTTEDKPNKDN